MDFIPERGIRLVSLHHNGLYSRHIRACGNAIIQGKDLLLFPEDLPTQSISEANGDFSLHLAVGRYLGVHHPPTLATVNLARKGDNFQAVTILF
ncbi:MAG: hypothetical protein V3S39_10885 [Thermodesulfobacteriota bacterium]